MNCSNCGSPLELRPFADRVPCLYCGCVAALGDRENGFDQLVWSDHPAERNCPRCECELVNVGVDGNTAAACPECHGVLLANHVFGAIVMQRRAGFRGAEPPSQLVDREQLHEVAHCPGCERQMETHIYGGPGCQVIDTCAACHLVWVDSGELSAIERAPGRR